MSEKIDINKVKQIARLARLELNDAEFATLSAQLSDILEYIEKLNELNTDSVEPLAHCLPVSNVFGADVIAESLGAEKTLANAPDSDGEFFKVPKILDDSSSA